MWPSGKKPYEVKLRQRPEEGEVWRFMSSLPFKVFFYYHFSAFSFLFNLLFSSNVARIALHCLLCVSFCFRVSVIIEVFFFFYIFFSILFISPLSPLPLLSIPSAFYFVTSVSIMALFYSFIPFKALPTHPSLPFTLYLNTFMSLISYF